MILNKREKEIVLQSLNHNNEYTSEIDDLYAKINSENVTYENIDRLTLISLVVEWVKNYKYENGKPMIASLIKYLSQI